MNEVENTHIRLKWLEGQINHTQAELYRLRASEAHYTNLLDGYQAELEELSSRKFELS